MHPWDRLHRAALGDSLLEPSGLETLLFARDKAPSEPRTVLAKVVASVKIRDPKVKRAPTVEPKPNAPLLKRIVRRPYALDPNKSKTRVQLRSGIPWADLEHEERPQMSAVLHELRAEVAYGNPVAEIRAMRDLDRPRPSADGWLGDLSNVGSGEAS